MIAGPGRLVVDVVEVRVAGPGDVTRQSIGGASGEPAPFLGRPWPEEAGRAARRGGTGRACATGRGSTRRGAQAGRTGCPGSPRRRRGPVTRRVAPRSLLDRTLVLAALP